MRLLLSTIFPALVLLGLFTQPVLAQFGPPLTPLQQKVQEALQSDIRTDEERARDQNRQAVQILDFLRLQDDMRVIELLPFGGWYTKILGLVLRDNGKLYVTQPSLGYFSNILIPTLALEEMDRVEEIVWNREEVAEEDPYTASGVWDVEPVDMVLTFRNYHNFTVANRAAIDSSVFAALKPGGLYGVIDHTRRHMEPANTENGRRVDPVVVIKEIQAAGFVLLDYSTILRKPDDELRYEVGRRSVTGNTDRFALLFMKPDD